MANIRARLNRLERAAAGIAERNAGCDLCRGTAVDQAVPPENIEALAGGICPQCTAPYDRTLVQVFDTTFPRLVGGSPALLVVALNPAFMIKSARGSA